MVLRPASVVEIGTGFGHGAVVLAWAAKAWGGKVVTVDIDRYRDAEIDVTGQATEAVALIRRVYDNVRLVVADTQSANDKTPILLETLASAKPDFAFIDGEHKGNAAYIDLASVWPLMPSGAVAVLDDAHSSVFDKAHARHPWCDDVFASATRFVRERRDEVADVCLWAYPRAGLRGPEDERPWVLIRKA
jgi:predicted O-methyltransferase YrrM